MSGVNVRIELKGVAEAQHMLRELADLGEDLAPIFDEIGAAMVASQQNRFQLGVEPDGTPWMESWRARHEGGKTLIDSGLLLSRLTHDADSNGVEWGFQDRRAPALHFGAVIKPKNKKALAFTGFEGHLVFAGEVVIPARPMVGVDAADLEAMAAIVAHAIERRASGSGSAP